MRMMITGAASGIGRSVALLAAEAASESGRSLLLMDLDGTGLDETCEAASRAGAKTIALRMDVSDPESCAAAAESCAREFGGIDSLVSNAGIIRTGLLSELSIEDFDVSFRINTRPTWLLAKVAYPYLVKSRGSVTATASISAQQPVPRLGTYAASKAALVALVRQMALEWGPDGIRCNCVSPGPTFSSMTKDAFFDNTDPVKVEIRRNREASIPLRKIGMPDEVANAILFLAGPQASNITAADFVVDGGLTSALMPATGGGTGRS